ILGGEPESEFMEVGPPDRHRAGRLQPGEARSGPLGPLPVEGRAGGGDLVGLVDQVLHGHGDTGERAGWRVGCGGVVVDGGEGVEAVDRCRFQRLPDGAHVIRRSCWWVWWCWWW